MKTDRNKEVVRKLFDSLNKHDGKLGRTLLTADYVYHVDDESKDAAFIIDQEEKHWQAYDNVTYTLLEMIAEGDRVAVRGLHEGVLRKNPDYKLRCFFNPVYRIADGKVAEVWMGSSRNSLDPEGSRLRKELAGN